MLVAVCQKSLEQERPFLGQFYLTALLDDVIYKHHHNKNQQNQRQFGQGVLMADMEQSVEKLQSAM